MAENFNFSKTHNVSSFIVPLLFYKEYLGDKQLKKLTHAESKKTLTATKALNIFESMYKYSQKKMKLILNYQQYFSLFKAYCDRVDNDTYETKLKLIPNFASTLQSMKEMSKYYKKWAPFYF